MKRIRILYGLIIGAMGLGVVIASAAMADGSDSSRKGPSKKGHEVWTIDQTDSRTGYGGYLHIYDGDDLQADAATAQPETIDLGGAANDLCLRNTGAKAVRPHMIVFNGGDFDGPGGNRYAAISFVVSGHVLIMDAQTREPLDCLRMSPGAGGAQQAHAMWPTRDQRYLVVANQNGKLLQRIRTDYPTRRFTLEMEATLSLYEGTTPSGAPKQDPVLRPDNAPICPRTTNDGRFTFVSLRGGGAFVVDQNASPMRIVAEYDRNTIDDNGCGQMQADDRMYVNAGAGAPGDPFGHKVYSFDLNQFRRTPSTTPNTPAPTLVYSREGEVDAHAVAVTKGEKYLLAGDRIQNDVTVVNTRRNEVVNRYSLVGPLSSDPAPDLFDLSPDGKTVYSSLRGPAPLSGGHDAIGATPGIGVIDVRRGGKDGAMVGLAPARRSDGKPPDPHAIRVRTLG